MHYSEPLFRPPAEAGSLIVQLTEGCAYNRCLFCPMYKSKRFSIKTDAEFQSHLQKLRKYYGEGHTRVFIADGDVLGVDTERLLEAVDRVKEMFPDARRFGVYGSVFSLAGKTEAELRRLKEAGLRMVYLGIESGDEETLRRVKKHVPPAEMTARCRKALEAGLGLSVMVIIGLGGRERSEPHIEASAELVNAVAPTHTSLLNLMLEHTPMGRDPYYTEFTIEDYFRETAGFISRIECRTIFRANHASNPVALEGVLPRDRGRLLAEIDLVRRRLAR